MLCLSFETVNEVLCTMNDKPGRLLLIWLVIVIVEYVSPLDLALVKQPIWDGPVLCIATVVLIEDVLSQMSHILNAGEV